MSSSRSSLHVHRPDRLIVRAIWPVLLAAVVSLFPFTIYSTFLVPISADTGIATSLAGTLRGLGGVAALLVGVGLAPLIARWSAPHTTAVGLGLLSITSLIATMEHPVALIVFCVGIGAATAILTPALLAMATGSQESPVDSGRAATLVTATQSLAAVLAAPLIGVVGWWQGWHAALWGTAGVAALVAVRFVRSPRASEVDETSRLGYRAAFQRLRRRRDLLALIGIAFLRTTAFMGYLAFLAAHYHDRFGLTALDITLVWTLSGAAFFAGNYLSGRWARAAGPRRGLLLFGGLSAATGAVIVVFSTEWLVVALAATLVMGFGHAIVAALITTLIAHRGGDLTTPAYSVNAAGMSLGVFTGAFIGGLGLGLAGTVGLTVALTVPTVVALPLARMLIRSSE